MFLSSRCGGWHSFGLTRLYFSCLAGTASHGDLLCVLPKHSLQCADCWIPASRVRFLLCLFLVPLFHAGWGQSNCHHVAMAMEVQLPGLASSGWADLTLVLESHSGQGWLEGVVGVTSVPAHGDSHSTILSCRFPQPQLPAMNLLPQVVGDTVALTFVAYAISVSLAMIYAEKHHYAIDPNQVCAQPGKLGSPQGGEVEPAPFAVPRRTPFPLILFPSSYLENGRGHHCIRLYNLTTQLELAFCLSFIVPYSHTEMTR